MNLNFIKSSKIKIKLNKDQYSQILSIENINRACKDKNIIAFDIMSNQAIIGFAMLKEYDADKWFLWNFAIDKNHQRAGFGLNSIIKLLSFMKEIYHAKEISTTYKFENIAAKKLYEKAGFIQTDIVDEIHCHEVNMKIEL